MRFRDDAEYQEFLRGRAFPQVKSAPEFSAAVKVEKPVGKPRGETLRIILPFKLPTWNRLLAMNQWERKAIRGLLHEAVVIAVEGKSFDNWNAQKYHTLLKGKNKSID